MQFLKEYGSLKAGCKADESILATCKGADASFLEPGSASPATWEIHY